MQKPTTVPANRQPIATSVSVITRILSRPYHCPGSPGLFFGMGGVDKNEAASCGQATLAYNEKVAWGESQMLYRFMEWFPSLTLLVFAFFLFWMLVMGRV
jgi:hypothetical protein